MNAPRGRRMLLITAVVIGAVLAVLVGFGVYGLVRGPAVAEEPTGTTAPAASTAETVPVTQPLPLPHSREPEAFARGAAMAIFGWDTRSSASSSEWGQVLVNSADPEEAAGIAADVRGYLPTIEQWEQLRTYGTRQWLTIDSARVPDAWATALAQAEPGQLPPGATAYTVIGVRHRAGTWADQATETESRVSFTVFLACPDGEACRLLRFSRLDEPLE